MRIRGWRIVLTIGFALAAGTASAATPVTPPAVQPAAPTVAPAMAPPAAAPGAAPAAPSAAEAPKGPPDEILLTTPPDTDNIASGNITFEPKAFPIVADTKEADIQHLLGQTRPSICRICRGTGKVTRKMTLGQRVDGKLLRPITNTYEETCPECRCENLKCPAQCPIMAKGSHLSCEACGGRGATCAALQFIPHCCGPCCVMRIHYYYYHTCPGDCCGRITHEPTCSKCQFCTTLRNLRAAHSRTNACDGCRNGLGCGKLRPGHGTLIKPEQLPWLLELVKDVGHFKRSGNRWTPLRQATIGRLNSVLEAHADRTIDALWAQTRIQPPAGQPALLIGQVQTLPAAQGVFQYGKIDNEQNALQAILISAEASEPLPSGRVLVGGLIVGRWRANASATTGVQEVPVVLVSASVPATATP